LESAGRRWAAAGKFGTFRYNGSFMTEEFIATGSVRIRTPAAQRCDGSLLTCWIWTPTTENTVASRAGSSGEAHHPASRDAGTRSRVGPEGGAPTANRAIGRLYAQRCERTYIHQRHPRTESSCWWFFAKTGFRRRDHAKNHPVDGREGRDGICRGPQISTKFGMKGPTPELFFRDVFVPATNVVGGSRDAAFYQP